MKPAIHYLPGNKAERSPGRWLFFDTETIPHDEGELEIHMLRLWVASLLERKCPSRKRPRSLWFEGHTADELAACIEDACRGGETLRICAHNLAFDLATTRIPVLLIERGWTTGEHALTSPNPWLRMRRGDRSITFCDSYSWLPHSEQTLAAAIGETKPPLPEWTDDNDVWFERCRRDVIILQRAMSDLLDWWDDQQLGSWSLTGPATGFHAYQHNRRGPKVLIDPTPEIRALERSAIYAGRAEVWRVGKQPRRPYAIIDFEHTFASICARLPLPIRRGAAFEQMPVDSRWVEGQSGSLMAECLVHTATPRYPLRTRKGVIHPVGTFLTLLCGPEMIEARNRGDLLAIGKGHAYGTRPHMADWARWAIPIIDDPDADVPQVARLAVKAWTRTVPGRWAGRVSRVGAVFDGAPGIWSIEKGRYGQPGAPSHILNMGGKRYWLIQDQDLDNAFPAVLAWIQSYVRVRLSRLIDLLGEECMVLCNTDGVIIDVAAWAGSRAIPLDPLLQPGRLLDALAKRLESIALETAPLRPRIKAMGEDLDVLSPQHFTLDDNRRLSGIPGSAEEISEHRYRFTDWPRLPTQLDHGGMGGYLRHVRTVNLARVPILRWRLQDGRTRPVEARHSPEGENVLLPWSQTSWGPQDAMPWPWQHPLIQPLADHPIEEIA